MFPFRLQVDNNDKLAIDLLFAFDNGRLNTPSGSSLKESLLIDKRKEILEEVTCSSRMKRADSREVLDRTILDITTKG